MSDRAPTQAGDEPAAPAATASEAAQPGGEVAERPASLWADAWRDLRRRVIFWVAVSMLSGMTVMAAFPGLFTDIGPNEGCNIRLAKRPPVSLNPFAAGDHPFGTDAQGCDYWSQVVQGARAPILIGLAVTAGTLLISIVLGSLGGYYGRVIDALLGRITDIFFGIPFVLGGLVILTAFPDHGLGAMSLVLIAFNWTTMTRLMRGQVIAVRDADYVQAARMLGAGDRRVIFRHILPNAIAPVIVVGTLNLGVVIAAEATLDFLGVGLHYPTVSWGLQLNAAQPYVSEYPHLMIYPSVFLSLTVLSFLLLGDAVRDALDPRLR
jgi:oligopeptide transport system permease protein